MSSPTEDRPLGSAFDSPTFGEDSSFHVKQPVGSMSISPCGRDVVLASKEGLHVIDLDSPYSPPRYLPHHTPWEVADVQWSPFAARDSWVVSTSNQKALVWNLAMKKSQNSIEHILHAHSRAITDINFSAHHPDVLATCAVDSFVHCWDLRIPARPVISFSDWVAGATQVKWNRQDSHVIASSHDRFLHIWDDRKGAYPLRTIEAHDTKIYGIDWNRIRREAIVTCSLDKSIKFWDYSSDSEAPEKVIHAPFPVWRARHTPFGWGVLAMPQRGNSDLHLYSRVSNVNPEISTELPLVHSFPGHNGQVKEFLWRPRGAVLDGLDHREFQLVSWGTDSELRLHRVGSEVLQGVGYEKGKSFNPALNITRKGAVYKTFHDESDPGQQLDGQADDVKPEQSHAPTNGISMPYSQDWTQTGVSSQLSGTHGRSVLRSDMDPISWMRGVKISGWEVETLGDEISHVGEKFTKVAFESVNVGQRKATISLHGPLGQEHANVFLKIDIKFPSEYPRAATPIFNVQKTTAMTSDLAKTVTSGLQTISEAYLSKKRGCLEGLLRFLLGEHSVEESVAFAKRGADETIKSPDMYDEDDSSDEDEDVGEFQGDELGLSSSEILRPINANVMVPVARACGALWANDGRLLCFFPPKKEKPTSFLGSVHLNEMSRLSRNDRVFEAFGRLQTGSPGPKHSVGTRTGTGGYTETDDGGSEYSDDSSIVSSSSSGSSDLLGSLPQQFHGPQIWRSSTAGYYHSKSTENSQKSTTGLGTAKSSSEGPQNTIYIYDFGDLLPAKRDLAENYRLFGNRTEICAHNTMVAANSGNHDLANVWGLVKLILQNQISSAPIQEDDIVIIARRLASDITRKEGATLPPRSNGQKRQFPRRSPPGKIRWGENPLGGLWLIPALFEYFERLADVQMLGMLSCVFYEPELRRTAKAHHPADPSSVQNRSFSISHTSPAARLQTQSQYPSPLLPKDAHLVSTSHSSACSSAEPWQVDTPPLQTTGTTPPMAVRAGRSSMDRKRQVVSLAGSPDQRSDGRSNPNFGTTVASSLSRSFTFGGSSSPPNGTSKKKPSPAESLNASGPGGWLAGGYVGKPASAVPDYVTASTVATSQTHSDVESERQASPDSTKPGKGVKITLKNQDMFDNDHQPHVPLLNDKQQELSRAYRSAYANLLFLWRMPIQQTEVLRIEAITDSPPGSRQRYQHRNSSLPSNQDRQLTRTDLDFHHPYTHEGLDIRRHCTRCGAVLHAPVPFGSNIEQSSHNGRTHTDQETNKCPQCFPAQPVATNTSCVICEEMVQGMFTPCLRCGHVTCFECHKQWFDSSSKRSLYTPDSEEDEIRLCASGCGCHCTDSLAVEVPMPHSPQAVAEEPSSNAQTQTKSPPKSRRLRHLSGLRPDKWFSSHEDHDNDDDQSEPWLDLSSAPMVRDTSSGSRRGQRQQQQTQTQTQKQAQSHHHRRKTATNQQKSRSGSSSAAWGPLLERVETM